MPKYVCPKHPGYQMIVRKEQIKHYPDGTTETLKPPLVVEFGSYGPAHTLTVMDDDGKEIPVIASPREGLPGVAYQTFEFQGGYIDTDALIKQKKDEGVWDDEDAEVVLRRLDEAVSNPNSPLFGWVKRFEEQHPGPPWPTYDQMAEDEIPDFALQAGLVVPAYYYEHSTAKRPEVLKALEAAVRKQEAVTSLEAPALA